MMRSNRRLPSGTLLLASVALLATSCGTREPEPAPGGSPPVDASPPPASGRLRVVGVLSAEGVECPALRGVDGKLYTLAGSRGSFEVGDTVEVIGRVAEVSTCMQGTTIAVDSIWRARRLR